MKAVILAISLVLIVPGCAQRASAPEAGSAAHKLTYDVVSIRPSRFEGMSVRTSDNRFVARGTTLWGLLYNAYDLKPNEDVPGLPGWAKSERFDVEAGMDAETYAELQKMPDEERGEKRDIMLQALLADRFKLKMHSASREGPIYVLVIAKGGPRLKEWPSNKTPGGLSWSEGGQIEARGAHIASFAFGLSDMLGRTVVDKTGLTGKYYFNLKWTPDEYQGTPDAGPTLFTAIEEQLGLKLESARGPVQTFVVDHVERPSEN